MNKIELLNEALSHYGEKETQDGVTNKQILYYLENVTGLEMKSNIPWCAAFIGSMLKDCGFKYLPALNARAYLKYGRAVKTPKLGDIVVFWRGNEQGWQGHIGFYISQKRNVIYVLGGNQNNKVCIKAYQKKQLLAYRAPVKV